MINLLGNYFISSENKNLKSHKSYRFSFHAEKLDGEKSDIGLGILTY